MENQRIIQVEDKVPFSLLVPLSIQHMLAMFGVSILTSFVFGINSAMVLFMNGVGILLLIGVIKRKASVYLGSSFAFLVLVGAIVNSFGHEYALGGFVAVSLYGCILVSIICKFGTEWIEMVLPPAAMSLVVALTELEPSSSMASNAGLLDEALDLRKTIVLVPAPGTVVLGLVLFRRLSSAISTLIAVIVGYVSILAYNIVDFAEVAAAPVFALPNLGTSKLNLEAIMTILPVPLVATSEHIGRQMVTSKIVEGDLLKDPGLHRSLFGDNFPIMISGLIGSVPTTTYGKNIGAMAVTRAYSVRVTAGTTVLPIICPFIGKFSTLVNAIPDPIIGGTSLLLYGMIGISDLHTPMDSRVDYENSRNLALISVISVTRLSGIAMKLGDAQFIGMVLACVVDMILSLVFYVPDHSKLANDQ